MTYLLYYYIVSIVPMVPMEQIVLMVSIAPMVPMC